MQKLFARAGRVLAFDVGGSHVVAALCVLDTLSFGPVVGGASPTIITLGLQVSGNLDNLEGVSIRQGLRNWERSNSHTFLGTAEGRGCARQA